MAIGIATEIIQSGVSDDLFNNILDEEDPKAMWDKFKAVCSQVGPGVVYSILQELLTYQKLNKPKGFEKLVTSIFAEVQFLVKQLRAAVTPNKDIWDSIAVVVATKALHKDFEHVTSGLLGQGDDKSIDEIQSILSSAEAKFLSKRAVGVTADLAHMSRNNSHKRKLPIATSEDECFNCHRMGHFSRDCKYPDYRLMKKKNTKQDRDDDSPKPRPRRANVAAAADEESDPEPFRPGKTHITAESTIMSRTRATWYLDFCASRHLTNNRSLFVEKIQPKAWDFTTAGGQIICSEGVGTVSIALADGSSIKLEGVSLVPNCESNLISLGQLREHRITYHDTNSSMLLMQDGVPIVHARRD